MSALASLLRSNRRPGHWLAGLAMAALLLRALVAPGYMPDAGAAHEGRLAVALCAGGLVELDIGKAGDPVDAVADVCDYAFLPPWTPEPTAVVMPAPGLRMAALAYRPLSPQRPFIAVHSGPPLGSRAPPAV